MLTILSVGSFQTCPPNFTNEKKKSRFPRREYHAERDFSRGSSFVSYSVYSGSFNERATPCLGSRDSKTELRRLLHRRCVSRTRRRAPSTEEERTLEEIKSMVMEGGAAFEKNHDRRGLDQVVSRVEIGPWPILHPRYATSDGVLTMRYVSRPLYDSPTSHNLPKGETVRGYQFLYE